MALKKRVVAGVIGAALALLAIGTAWTLQQRSASDLDGISAAATLPVSSSSFTNGQTIPSRLTCDGPDVSPDIQWGEAPAATQSYAIVMNDPDAPLGFTHWLAYNIPANIHELPEGASTPTKRIDQAGEGINSFGNVGYGGPCPPGATPHHYVFHVYALDVNPGLAAGVSTEQVVVALKAHVLAEGQITGLYGRSGGWTPSDPLATQQFLSGISTHP
jgi:Raf kinase inhibitor-like YbhB/YbcL family protein